MSKKGKVNKRSFQEIEDSFVASYLEKYTALYEGDVRRLACEIWEISVKESPL